MAVLPYRPPEGLDLVWLAGWLEGEGSFYARLYRPHYLRIIVSACSTDEDTIDKVHGIVGGSRMGPNSASKPEWSPQWRWAISSRANAVDLTRRVRPFMSVRRCAQIDQAIALEAATPVRTKANHGTRAKYNWGCRCGSCTLANTLHGREMNAKRRQAQGVNQ